MKKHPFQTGETRKTRSYNKARRDEKGVRADPLADRLFHRGGRFSVARLRRIFVCYSAPFLLICG